MSNNPLAQRYNDFINTFPKDLSGKTKEELITIKTLCQAHISFYHVLEQSMKTFMNSLYGALGTAYFRYSNFAVAGDICGEGQYYVKLMDTDTNDYFRDEWDDDPFYQVFREKFSHIDMYDKPKPILEDICVYGDTDSNYFEFGKIFESCGINFKKVKVRDCSDMCAFIMSDKLNVMYDKNLKDSFLSRHGEHTMKFEHELTGKKGLWDAKKNYVISKIWEDGHYIAEQGKLKAVGIELVKQSNSQYVKDVITKFINYLLSKDDIDSKTMYSMCSKVKDSFKDVTLEDIAIKKKLGTFNKWIQDDRDKIVYIKHFDKNGRKISPQPQVRGSARYNHLIHTNKLGHKYPFIKEGDKIHFFYDEYGEPFSFPDGITYPKEIAPDMCLDTQLEKLVFTPVKRLMDGAVEGIDIKQVGNKIIQSGFNFKKMKRK